MPFLSLTSGLVILLCYQCIRRMYIRLDHAGVTRLHIRQAQKERKENRLRVSQNYHQLCGLGISLSRFQLNNMLDPRTFNYLHAYRIRERISSCVCVCVFVSVCCYWFLFEDATAHHLICKWMGEAFKILINKVINGRWF